MGRPALFKKGALTAAERQRRRRQRLRRERSDELQKIAAQRAADDRLNEYIPYPPGITYWELVPVQTPEGPREMWLPNVKPLARIAHDELTDEEIVGLVQDLVRISKARGLEIPWATLAPRSSAGVMVCDREQWRPRRAPNSAEDGKPVARKKERTASRRRSARMES